MNKQGILTLINMLGIRAHEVQGNWIQVKCPLAHATHADHDDVNPSCGISINEEGPSTVHCFTCGARSLGDTLHGLIWHRYVSSETLRYYLDHEILGEPEKEVIEYREKFDVELTKAVPIPHKVFSNFDHIKLAKRYLDNRGIEVDVAERHGLMYCREFVTASGKLWKNAIAAPVRDFDFNAYWIHFRSTDSKRFWHGRPEHFGINIDWGRNDSWFGIEFLDLNGPIYVVEGIFDCLRLKTLGVSNVIASHGGIGRNSQKVKRLALMYPKLVYLGFDDDKAGNTYKKILRQHLKCDMVDLKWSKVGAKDPGELKSKEDFLKVRNSTKDIEYKDKFKESIYESI